MMRQYIAGFCVLLLCLGLVVAEEAKGKFDDVQKGKKGEGTLILVLTVDGKKQDFWFYIDDDRFPYKVFKGDKELPKRDGQSALQNLKRGADVTVKYNVEKKRYVLTEARLPVANAANVEKGSLKDDFNALTNNEGTWTANPQRAVKVQVLFAAKEFPILRVTVKRFAFENEGKDVTTIELYSGDATIQEKDGKRVLTIEGSDIAFSMKEERFLDLKGSFKSKTMKIDLTETYGKTRTEKGKK